MLIFKTKSFNKWAKKMGVLDSNLALAIFEMEKGLIDAELGKFLYKKRISLQNKGKRGGARTIIAYKNKDKAYFLYGFAKNEKENIDSETKETLRRYAEIFMNFNVSQLNKAIFNGEIIEVNHE